VTTKVAAEALGVNPRTVRAYIERGDLEAKAEGEGVEKAYLVSIDSVYSLRDRRGGPRHARERTRDRSASADDSADLTSMLRDLTAELIRSTSEAAEYRTRLELTEVTESSLREDLERVREERQRHQEEADRLREELGAERVRREQAEKDRDELASRRAELEPAPEVREGDPETLASANTEEGQGVEAPLRQEHRPWWRRWFGA